MEIRRRCAFVGGSNLVMPLLHFDLRPNPGHGGRLCDVTSPPPLSSCDRSSSMVVVTSPEKKRKKRLRFCGRLRASAPRRGSRQLFGARGSKLPGQCYSSPAVTVRACHHRHHAAALAALAALATPSEHCPSTPGQAMPGLCPAAAPSRPCSPVSHAYCRTHLEFKFPGRRPARDVVGP